MRFRSDGSVIDFLSAGRARQRVPIQWLCLTAFHGRRLFLVNHMERIANRPFSGLPFTLSGPGGKKEIGLHWAAQRPE